MNLLTLNSNNSEPQDYAVRKTVKAIVVNENNEVLMFGSALIGGGVEEDERDEDAIKREAIEEAGIHIEILELLGEVIQYRDFLKKKYIVIGYVCKQVGVVTIATSTQSDEQGIKATWKNIQDVIKDLESEIDTLKAIDPNTFEEDIYQSKLFNRETTVWFLKEFLSK